MEYQIKNMKTCITVNSNSGSNRRIKNIINIYSNFKLTYVLPEEYISVKESREKPNLSKNKITNNLKAGMVLVENLF